MYETNLNFTISSDNFLTFNFVLMFGLPVNLFLPIKLLFCSLLLISSDLKKVLELMHMVIEIAKYGIQYNQ